MRCLVPQKRPGNASSHRRTLSCPSSLPPSCWGRFGVGSGPQLCKGRLRGWHAELGPTLGTAKFLVSVGRWEHVASGILGQLGGAAGGSWGTRLGQRPEDDTTRVAPHYRSVVGSFPVSPEWAERMRLVGALRFRKIPFFTHVEVL